MIKQIIRWRLLCDRCKGTFDDKQFLGPKDAEAYQETLIKWEEAELINGQLRCPECAHPEGDS